MKSAILLFLTGACLCAQQQGSLEGTAINAITREPLGNVHVRLIAAGFAGFTAAYGAMSDRAGHFSIATIRPGTYMLLPERPGFMYVRTKAASAVPTVTIKPGEHLTAYQLEMAPRAVLAGRVVDEAGDPVEGVRVQTVPTNPDGAPILLTPAPNPATDDRGEFRLIGPAGKYYLQATISAPPGGERPEVRSDGTTEAIYGTTFYPSSARKERAAVVEALAGKDVAGLEIRLVRQQPGLSIGGVITGIPEGPARPQIIMQWGEKAPMITNGRGMAAAADGRFKLEPLQPGFYRIWAQYSDGKAVLQSRMLEYTLENTDIGGVELALVPGLEVSGKVRMEGDAPESAAPKRTVRLEAAPGMVPGNPNKSGAVSDSDGVFRITGLAPGRYRVKVEPLPDTAYVKTVEVDGRTARDGFLDLSTAAKGVTANILIGRNGVTVSGHVLDASGDRMQGTAVMIYMLKEFSDMPAGGFGTARADADGKYTLKSVAPGKYKLFAVDTFQIRGGSAIDAIKEMFNRAEEVEFKEGDRITKDLKVMPKEDPNAKPNQ